MPLLQIWLTLGTLAPPVTILETKSVRAVRTGGVVHSITQTSPILILYHAALIHVILSEAHDLNSSFELDATLELPVVMVFL